MGLTATTERLKDRLSESKKLEIGTEVLFKHRWIGAITDRKRREMLKLCDQLNANSCDYDMKSSTLLFIK